MTRVPKFLIAAGLAVIITSALTFAALYLVQALMGWRAFWVMGSGHFSSLFVIYIMLFNNCVVLPIVIMQRRRTEKCAEEPKRLTPLSRQSLKNPHAL